jgi:hypothetical protein
MCSPRYRVRLVWWMHAGPVDGLHWQRRKIVEAIVILDRRLVVWVVSVIPMPSRTMIIERLLVVVAVLVLVVHLELTHIGLQETYRCCVSVLDRVQGKRLMDLYQETTRHKKPGTMGLHQVVEGIVRRLL